MTQPKFKAITTVLIWSENFRALADWYQKTLDLVPIDELNHPQDTGILFRIGQVNLWIGQHSQVHGKNSDASRHMFNIEVDSVTQAYAYLTDKGVEFFCKPFKAPTFDRYFATFYDLDRNFVQIIGGK